MATLCLDPEFESHAHCELHHWLRGDWALLFSNPGDFQLQGRSRYASFYGFGRELAARGVRAVALKRGPGPVAQSGIDELDGPGELVRLREPAFAAADSVSFAARTLRGQLLTMSSFVLIVDGSLKRQRAIRYDSAARVPLPSDLLTLIDALGRGSLHQAA